MAVDAEGSASDPDLFDIVKFADRTLIAKGACEHVVIAEAAVRLRLDIASGTVLNGPVRLHHRLAGAANLGPKIAALHQLCSLCSNGHFANWRLAPDLRFKRLVLALRAFDARTEGASLREAAMGLGGWAGEWPGPGESTKSWIRRLIALGDEMIRAGPAGILNGEI